MAVAASRVIEMEDLRARYEAKARAELADADALAGSAPGSWTGDPMGEVALVVGTAANAEAADLLTADMADALAKALAALGFDTDAVFTIVTRPDGADPAGVPARLRLALEAVDAPLAIALDARAAGDLAAAFGVELLVPGQPVTSVGRVLGYVGDFAGSLGDAKAKAAVWVAIRRVAAAAGHRTKAKRP